jgi:hypothetical protein
LALLFVLFGFSLPAFAADYSPWPGSDDDGGACSVELAQSSGPSSILPKGGTGEGSQKPPQVRAPGDYCCVHCRWNETPCGNTCISKTEKGLDGKPKLCLASQTCACPGKP